MLPSCFQGEWLLTARAPEVSRNHRDLITRVSMPHMNSNLDTEICKARQPSYSQTSSWRRRGPSWRDVSHIQPGMGSEAQGSWDLHIRVWLLRRNSRDRQQVSLYFFIFCLSRFKASARMIQNPKARVKMHITLPGYSIIYIFLKGGHGWRKCPKRCVCAPF